MTDIIPMAKRISYNINVRTSIMYIYVCLCTYISLYLDICNLHNMRDSFFCSSELTDGSGFRKWNVAESALVV